jgi:Flp pilus assembly protein TadG
MFRVALFCICSETKNLLLCRRGAAATELTLILPLFTGLILGVLEFGSVIYSYSAMQFGANRVARTVAVNRMTNAQAESSIRDNFPTWARNHVQVRVTQTNASDPNTNLVRVQLSVDSDKTTPLPLLTRAVPWALTANVAIKQELPYVD